MNRNRFVPYFKTTILKHRFDKSIYKLKKKLYGRSFKPSKYAFVRERCEREQKKKCRRFLYSTKQRLALWSSPSFTQLPDRIIPGSGGTINKFAVFCFIVEKDRPIEKYPSTWHLKSP